jgi:hypothetical protein
MKKLRKLTFGQERQAEKLDDIFGLDKLQAYVRGNQLLAGAEYRVPNGKHNPVIAVVLFTQRRMMRAVQVRRNDHVGKQLFAGEGEVPMVKQHEKHANDFADHDDAGRDAEQNDAQAFHQDFEELVQHVEPQPGRDVVALIAVMDLVKAPQGLKSVAQIVPDIDCEIEQDEAEPCPRSASPIAE